MGGSRGHWENVYTRPETAVRWVQRQSGRSLVCVTAAAAWANGTPIIDVGGASALGGS
jgi:hypothetical protein